jgi:hypothetical protein
VIITPVAAHRGRLGAVFHPADVQRTMLGPGGSRVPPLETSVRLALVVQAVASRSHVQLPIAAHGLHANVLPTVLPVASRAVALA